MGIRILLTDDHQIVREGLRSLLEKQPDMEVVAEAADGITAIELARELTPDIVLMDVGLPGLSGVDATRRIVAENPDIIVIGLSMHADGRFVETMLEAGAKGYLLKDCAFEELAKAILSVLENGNYISSEVKGAPTGDRLRTGTALPPNLTPQERNVLRVLAEGKSTKEAASALRISVKTVETHRQHIMAKAELDSMAELTKFALRKGLTTLEG